MSFDAFENMRLLGLEPDHITFISILSTCSHAGLADIGVECFEAMSKLFGPKLDPKHYALMIDLHGRAGDFCKVANLLERMPTDLHVDFLPVWSSLLGICHIHKNAEMGKVAFDHVIERWPDDEATPYIIMSNIYADAGMMEIARELNHIATGKCMHRDSFC
jgi:hypothetical protein